MNVVVLGSVNMDLVLRCARLPVAGETVHGGDLATWPGGKGANQAVAAARLGARVSFVGCAGDDAFGATASAALRAEGIDVQHLRRVAGMPTGLALITVDDAGQNSIVLSSGANRTLGVNEVEAARALIESAGMLVCQLEVPLAAVQHAIGIAHAAGVRVLLNPAPGAALPPSLLAQVDVLVANEGEAALLEPQSLRSSNAAQALRALGSRSVVVTLGERGVLAADEGGAWSAPAVAARAVDTTGAGDTFVGALAAALVDGQSFAEALQFAQRAASISVTRAGAMPSMPRRSELGA